jgi:hypothetical protein
VTDPPPTSINSTSANSTAAITGALAEQPRLTNANYSLFAINDLGMHCADLDARVVNILPPTRCCWPSWCKKEPARS